MPPEEKVNHSYQKKMGKWIIDNFIDSGTEIKIDLSVRINQIEVTLYDLIILNSENSNFDYVARNKNDVIYFNFVDVDLIDESLNYIRIEID